MMGDLLSNTDKEEYVICAAIYVNNGEINHHQPKNIEIGFVVSGRRHHNCFCTIMAITGNERTIKLLIDDAKIEQGFLTSKDRFINRKEAGLLAYSQGQIKKQTDCLFSEDLY